jgi:osmotically inducible lipoprotein OsmB
MKGSFFHQRIITMKNIIIAVCFAGTLAGCNQYSQTDRAIGGGLIGAGAGAVVGGLATRSAGGAVAGAVIGGAGGAIIGAATTPRGRGRYYANRNCRGYDDYGNVVRYAC